LYGPPQQVTGPADDAYRSLAVRDLLRGESTRLPSGEDVARLLGVEAMTGAQMGHEWPHGTPLWFYILKEAEHFTDGNALAWPLIAGGAAAVARSKPAGVLVVCAGAALTAVFVLPDVTSFHRSVLPFAGPAGWERALVVLALGCGAGAAVAGAATLRHMAACAPA
jgi:hypothetical protein